MELAPLHMKDSKDKIKFWQIKAKENGDEGAIITTKHGYLGGKIQVKDKLVKTGKNLGKKNETTPFEQACLQIQSQWQKKNDKGYVEDTNGESNVKLPMLALKFKERKHDISYPAFCQPKLNGVRCLARKNGNIDLISRKGKSYNAVLERLIKHLDPLMADNETLDGEIYVHGWSFQRILRAVKKLRPDTMDLQYHVYDLADNIYPFSLRTYALEGCIPFNHKTIVHVPTHSVYNEQDVYDFHNKFVQEGYEGVIIRNSDSPYIYNHRSKDLQKYKEFFDAEFKIVGGEAELVVERYMDGHIETECVVFTVEIESGATFNVRPKGTVSMRAAWWKDLENITGKDLTVRYQELSEDGIPIFPVGIAIRDYE